MFANTLTAIKSKQLVPSWSTRYQVNGNSIQIIEMIAILGYMMTLDDHIDSQYVISVIF